jgi:hypothetical protein
MGDSGKTVGIIVGSVVGAFVLIALVALFCCCCMHPGSGMSPRPINDYGTVNSYQMPSVQQRPWFSGYGEPQCNVVSQNAPQFFQKSPFGDNNYATRYQPAQPGSQYGWRG